MKPISTYVVCKCGNKFRRYKTTDNCCPNCKFKKMVSNKQKRANLIESGNELMDTTTKNLERFKSHKNKPKVKSELSKARNRADLWFSRYIRLKHSINGICKCITCGKYHGIMNIDCGHFLSRQYLSTRYHPDNARPQGASCNRFKQGMSFQFEQALVKEIGQERVDNLKEIAKKTCKASVIFYQQIESKYKQLVKEMQENLGKKYW